MRVPTGRRARGTELGDPLRAEVPLALVAKRVDYPHREAMGDFHRTAGLAMNSDATCAVSEEPTVVIGDDESDENQWFSRLGGVARMSDGSIVAVDRGSAQIRVYDPDGRHLRTDGQAR